ncbi:hypothetical protein CLOP_g21133 [Closterium sp. NIES-67]|nr:hypothetical protein CLOP_g21133 [Closterium sp. NIES-67]
MTGGDQGKRLLSQSAVNRWLKVNSQDAAKCAEAVHKLLDEGADSFGKRAELMYARRPDISPAGRPAAQPLLNSRGALRAAIRHVDALRRRRRRRDSECAAGEGLEEGLLSPLISPAGSSAKLAEDGAGAEGAGKGKGGEMFVVEQDVTAIEKFFGQILGSLDKVLKEEAGQGSWENWLERYPS